MYLTSRGTDLYKQYSREIHSVHDRYAKKKLRTLQERKLKEIVAYAAEKSKFYKKHLATLDPIDEITLANLGRLPFTTKQDLRSCGTDILSLDLKDCTYYYETTGTTGKPTPCPRNPDDLIQNSMNIAAVWRKIFKNQKPIIGLMGPNELHSYVDTVSFVSLINEYCVFKMWPYSPMVGFKKALKLLQDYKIDVLACTPGMAMRIYRESAKEGLKVGRDFNIKTIMLTGEMTTEELCANISSLYNAKVLNALYGSQEAFVMAASCEHGHLHVFENSYIYELEELQDNDGKSAPNRELVITMLHKGAKPLIRFRTGDLASFPDIRCESNPMPVIEIAGRVDDVLMLNGNAYSPNYIEKVIFRHIKRCLGYQIVLNSRAGTDTIDVNLEFDPDAVPESQEIRTIENEISGSLSIEVRIHLIQDFDDVINTGAMVGWKIARVVDKRDRAGAAERPIHVP